jgi:hypothetical protein
MRKIRLARGALLEFFEALRRRGVTGRSDARPRRGRGGEAIVSTYPFGVEDQAASRHHVAFERRLM